MLFLNAGAKNLANMDADLEDSSADDAAKKQQDEIAKMMGFSGFGKLFLQIFFIYFF